jgi:FkbM family methyltransferase
MKGTLRSSLGLLKSRLIYDYKPFNRKKMLRFYSQFVAPCDLCFDVGAHTGNRSGTWLQLGGRVVAFEPQPVFIKLLQKKYGNYPEFSLEKCALGSREGKARLFMSRMNPAIATVSDQWKQIMVDYDASLLWEDETETDLHTLDEMIGRYGIPAFCKIDVEGYEMEVLSGLSKALPALSFEFFPTTPDRTIECIERLVQLGQYIFNWSLTESFRFQSPQWLTAEEMGRAIKHYGGRKSGDVYAQILPVKE